MTHDFIEWLRNNNIDLSKHHGNIGDYNGNIAIETAKNVWIFWKSNGVITEQIIGK